MVVLSQLFSMRGAVTIHVSQFTAIAVRCGKFSNGETSVLSINCMTHRT